MAAIGQGEWAYSPPCRKSQCGDKLAEFGHLSAFCDKAGEKLSYLALFGFFTRLGAGF
jgi:hypothetical protein